MLSREQRDELLSALREIAGDAGGDQPDATALPSEIDWDGWLEMDAPPGR